MTVTIVLTVSVILQFTAAVLALRLVRLTERKAAWLLIATAIVLMGVRRSITAFHLLSGNVARPPDLSAELVALVISILMVVGVGCIAPFFRSAHRAEEALQESEHQARENYALLQGLIEGTPDPVFLKDCDGRYRLLNTATARALGKESIKEVIGKDDAELIPFDQARQLQENDRRIMESGESAEYEEWVQTVEGPRLFRTMKTPYRDETGAVAGLIGVARDITKHRQAEEELEKSEHEKALVLDNAGEIIAYHDTNHCLQWGNRAYLKATGLSLTELKGKKCYEAWGLDRLCYNCPVTKAIETGEISEAELTPQNQEHWPPDQGCWLSRAAPVRDSDGSIIGAIEVAYDITERKKVEEERIAAFQQLQAANQQLQASEQQLGAANQQLEASNQQLRATEQQLRASNQQLAASNQQLRATEQETRQLEARLRLQIERMPIGLIVWDEEFRAKSWNPAAESIFGFTAEEMLGRHPLGRIVPEEAQTQVESIWRRLLEGDMTAYSVNENITKDGRKIICDWSNTPIKDPDGKVSDVLSMVQDITERKQLEDQFRQAQRLEALGRLTGGVAHDFNNLLTVILGHCEMMMRKMEEETPLRKRLSVIRETGQRAAGLVRQLLAFSRKQVLNPRVLDLNKIVANTDKMLRRLIGEDIEIETILKPELWHVEADPGQMEQVVMNLATNARDAMPQGGKLTIETRNVELDETYAQKHAEVTPGPYVMFAMSDNGCGMDPETMLHIFEPFFTTKGIGKGTGLGLATIHGIVKQSGGHIWVYSELGEGTTFRVYFPKSQKAPGTEAEQEIVSTREMSGDETVLVVEDEAGVRRLVCDVLADNGYAVLEAADGKKALEKCGGHKGPIHLLVTDVVMPEMGGAELAKQMMEKHPDLKVLFTSGYTDDAIVHHGVLDKGVEFIEKPFTPASLSRKVREVLDKPGAETGG